MQTTQSEATIESPEAVYAAGLNITAGFTPDFATSPLAPYFSYKSEALAAESEDSVPFLA